MTLAAAVSNPKLRGRQSLQSQWYPYYPGFSETFVDDTLRATLFQPEDWVLDPWNGSGTTTSSATLLGINARGYDLNPVMVVVARARSLAASQYSRLRPVATELTRQAKRLRAIPPDDPLSQWLHPKSVEGIRGIEAAVQRVLIDDRAYMSLRERGIDAVSDLAAFFYVALFRTLRHLLRPFLTSNPTWIKRPKSSRDKLRPECATIRDSFRRNLDSMFPPPPGHGHPTHQAEKVIRVGSSEKLPLPNNSINCVIGSPPYCTRIDYAVATSPELAILGYSSELGFETLRRQLIGTSTVPSNLPKAPRNLGRRCLAFLDAVSCHSSKASSTYYYKNHLQYFLSIAGSLSEIHRVLKIGGRCVLVVQDSYYKDIHNDLPGILSEMARVRGLHLCDRTDFTLGRTLAGINRRAKEYRKSFSAVESVLVLQKAVWRA